jgi:ankyrin repeat protein
MEEFRRLRERVERIKISDRLHRCPRKLGFTLGNQERRQQFRQHTSRLWSNPNICDLGRRSPLHYAARCASPTILTKLLEHEADLHITTVWGSTALHFACVQGDRVEFLKALLDEGVPINQGNNRNRTALFETAK